MLSDLHSRHIPCLQCGEWIGGDELAGIGRPVRRSRGQFMEQHVHELHLKCILDARKRLVRERRESA